MSNQFDNVDFEAQQMQRRMGAEAYGEMVAKMMQQVSGEEHDPAKIEMIKNAFADSVSPKPAYAIPYPPAPPHSKVRPPVWIHRIDADTYQEYDWRAFVSEATSVCFGKESVQFFKFEKLLGTLQWEPAAEFKRWHSEVMAANDIDIDAEFAPEESAE